MSIVLYDSREARCKSPFGAVAAGTCVTFRLFLPIVYQLSEPELLVFRVDEWNEPAYRMPLEAEDGDGVCEQHAVRFTPPVPELLFYRFEVKNANGLMYIAPDRDGFGMLVSQSENLWQMTVYDAAMRTPDFLKHGVMYQIFPDRFCASKAHKSEAWADRRMHTDWYELPEYLPDEKGEITNSDYFGGDLRGIIEKLPYLHSMGVGVIYLNPIFEAHSNHRYNTADYMKVDPMLGTQSDLEELCEKAREMGMYILLDGVFNHTGSDSVYFNRSRRYGDGGAYNDNQSPYYSWYNFINYPNEYESWWGFNTLPSINESDESYVDFICGENGVLHTWLSRGVAGFRLDVADELPDNFLDSVCRTIKRYDSQAAVIGEVWEDASTKVSYGVRRRYLLGGQLDSVMNYPFRDAILAYVRHGESHQFYRTVMSIIENYPKPVLDVLMNSLSTHDVERAITALAGEPAGWNDRIWQGKNNDIGPARYELGKKLFRLASLLQYMLPGIPCLYYGDEAGLYGYKDPFNRSCYPWGREDKQLLEMFSQLGAIRTSYPCLATASFSALSVNVSTAAFVRSGDTNEFYVAINRTAQSQTILVPDRFLNGVVLFGAVSGGKTLEPYGCVVLLRRVTVSTRPGVTRGKRALRSRANKQRLQGDNNGSHNKRSARYSRRTAGSK